MDHIWTIENWEQNIDFMEEGHRTGFRLRFDSGIDPEVRRACKEFAAFLRKEYFFPLRVVAYIKNKKKIRAMDGDLVYGTFWSMEDDYTVEPYIRVAAGDYLDLCDKWGKDSALTAILLTIGHELTHYFQWINALELTPIGMERQATKYARYVLCKGKKAIPGEDKGCYEIIKENRHDTRLHNEAGADFRIAYMRGECAAAAIWNRRYAGNRQFLRFRIPCRGGDEQSAC